MIDMNELQLDEQEYHNNHYAFFGVPIVCTIAFRNAFEEEYEELVRASLRKLREKYPNKNYDYLQVFHFRDITFWAIADAHQNERMKDEHVTFLLPSDY